MLTDLQKFAFALHSVLFFYTCQLPFNWNKEKTRFMISNSITRWTVWLATLFILCIHVALYAFCAVWYGWFSPRPDFTWLNSFLFLIGAIILSLFVFTAYTIIRHRRLIVNAMNLLIQISTNMKALSDIRCCNSKTKYQDATNDQPNVFDYAICGFVFLGAVFPFGMTIVSLLSDFDVLNFILDDIIPTSVKTNFSVEVAFYTILLRACSAFIQWLEISRTSTHIGCCMVTSIDHCCRILKLLSNNFIAEVNIFTGIYIYLQIIHGRVKKLVEMGIYLGAFFVFWGTVTASWISIRCYGKIDWAVYNVAVAFAVTLVLGNLLLFPELVKASLRAVYVVNTHYKVMQLMQAFSKEKSKPDMQIKIKRVRAIRPIVFWYGTFCIVDQMFLVDYLWVLMNRTVEAILIIDAPNFN